MRCPKCGCLDDKVIDSRSSREGSTIRRRRECLGCGFRFTTYEEIQNDNVMVVKRDGRREAFSKEKLLSGMIKACEKRPVSRLDLDHLAARIVQTVLEEFDKEVPYQRIGELTMNGLRILDKVAYVRYASIYRRFDEASDFIDEVEKLESQKNDTATLRLPGI
jgi:transcriptional repressor NrdR